MILAALILAHSKPRQVARLVGRLDLRSPVLIHFDARAGEEAFAELRRLVSVVRPDAVFVKRHACRWGAAGIMDATVELIRALVASNRAFDRAILLSGSDYPIKANGQIGARLRAAGDKEFIESFDLLVENRWSDHDGMYFGPNRVLGRYLRFRSHILRLPGRRKMPLGLAPFGGSQWWCLTRPFLEYAVHYWDAHPEFLRFFRGTFIPDECFMQTLISNSPFAGAIDGDNLHYAVWDRAPVYPATLAATDLPALSTTQKLFARKFDIDDGSGTLDLIDESLLKAA